MEEGSAWTQPPRIKHLIMDYSDDVELLEVILPAEFKTVELDDCHLTPSFRGGAQHRDPGSIAHRSGAIETPGSTLRVAPE